MLLYLMYFFAIFIFIASYIKCAFPSTYFTVLIGALSVIVNRSGDQNIFIGFIISLIIFVIWIISFVHALNKDFTIITYMQPILFMFILCIVSILISFIINFFIIQQDLFRMKVGMTILLSIPIYFTIYGVIYYNISQFFVTESYYFESFLERCATFNGGANFFRVIKFEDDEHYYEVPNIYFKKYNNLIGAMFYYEIYFTVFGGVFIKNIKLIEK